MPETVEEQLAYLKALKDEDIDFSDIPLITDFSGFVRIRDYPTREAAYEAARRLHDAKRKAAE